MRQILMDHTMDVVSKCVKRNASEADEDDESDFEVNSKLDLQRWVSSLDTAQLERLVVLLEQWNSNRRMASLAQMLLGLVLAAVPPSKLAAIEGMNAICGTLLSYSSRHMARVDSLLQKTFLFDLVLQSSGQGLALQDEPTVGVPDPGKKVAGAAAEDALRRAMSVPLGPDADDDSQAGATASAPRHASQEEDDEWGITVLRPAAVKKDVLANAAESGDAGGQELTRRKKRRVAAGGAAR